MATVTLTWQIEGVHDGIGVYRSNHLATGYELIATLPPNTTLFEDEFLLSQLTNKYGTEPDILFYRLDAFRGLDVKQSDPVPVPLEDTMPEFLADKGYLDEVPEVSDDPAVTYYNIGSKYTFQDGSDTFHVLMGVRTTEQPFITDPQNGYSEFGEMNQFLRNLPVDSDSMKLAAATEFTGLARAQAALGAAADMRVDALLPFINRQEPVMEVLPTKSMMDQLETEIADLASKLSLSGHFWTSSLVVSNTNEFGQITDINVYRHPVSGGSPSSVSILGPDTALTLTFLLIKDSAEDPA